MEELILSDRLGPVTVEEFEQMPDCDGYRTDLVRGWVVREPPAGYEHGEIAAELIIRLGIHARATGAGKVVTSETGFILSRELRTVRGPDAAFVSARRRSEIGAPVGFFPGAPDLAVEVVSPSNRWSDIALKVRDYLEAGTRIVWIVDPPTRAITVYRQPGGAPLILEGNDLLDGGDVLPGFSVKVSDLFGPE